MADRINDHRRTHTYRVDTGLYRPDHRDQILCEQKSQEEKVRQHRPRASNHRNADPAKGGDLDGDVNCDLELSVEPTDFLIHHRRHLKSYRQ